MLTLGVEVWLDVMLVLAVVLSVMLADNERVVLKVDVAEFVCEELGLVV